VPIGPEDLAREKIDAMLGAAGWEVQDAKQANLQAARGVAVRYFPLASGFGEADYLLFVDGKAAGVVEAKKAGQTLTGVELQSQKYSEGMPATLPAAIRPLPFLYESTGEETRFTNRLDPMPRSRRVFHFHRPETIAAWLAEEPVFLPEIGGKPDPGSEVPATLRRHLQTLPSLPEAGLWRVQRHAIQNLEKSLHDDRPRALVQMATGSGKTWTAVASIYRLIKFGGASRVLFLVDRNNLGTQALREFQSYATPDDGRKFTELYNVQHLTSNRLDPVARVVITTIQRLYSMLRGEDLAPEDEEDSMWDSVAGVGQPSPVIYNPAIPIEFFDVVFTDECHRSIYNLWRQVLEYFDAFLVGLTATPSKQTLGFFEQNLVMEYGHEQAVADGVNVDFDVYRIRTRITEEGSKVEAGLFVDRRDRETRKVRWDKLDEDLVYVASQLDRDVVAKDQIRTVLRTFKQKLPTEIFPGRTEVPKTLVFAKDDSHADDIVQIAREEFGKGNDFAQKITSRTSAAKVVDPKTGAISYKSTGLKAEDLLSSFRNSYNPRIAVTVDMLATGTDVRPLEIVMFMRQGQSRNYFEQMKGRGVRVASATDLQQATPDATVKTHFVIVDCVGVCESDLSESKPLEKKPSVPFEKLLQYVGFGSTDPDVLSSLAGRLARLERRLGKPEREALAKAAGGLSLGEIAGRIVNALDPDEQRQAACVRAGLPLDADPGDAQLAEAASALLKAAAEPLATNPALRTRLVDLKKSYEQTIDALSKDEVLEVGFSQAARDAARTLVDSFEKFIADNKDEITALQVLYSRPYRERLRYEDIAELAERVQAPPRSWTPQRLWQAYEKLAADRVRGSGGALLTDLVSLVRFALHHEGELVPYADQVEARFAAWLVQQETRGRRFTDEQRQWLVLIRDHIAANLGVAMEDFDYPPFAERGGRGRAVQVFGTETEQVLDELNRELAA
jgi:type I restriction enzyme R subunit